MRDKEIKQTISHGQVLHTPYIKVYLNCQPDQPSLPQLACIVSKKISGSAVIRHHYQRWLRASVNPLLKTFPAGTNIVLIAKPTLKQAKSFSQLKKSLVPVLQEKIKPAPASL